MRLCALPANDYSTIEIRIRPIADSEGIFMPKYRYIVLAGNFVPVWQFVLVWSDFTIRPSVLTTLFVSMLLAVPCISARGDEAAIQKAVVKVNSKNRLINLSSPWRKSSPTAVSGSGVIISPGRVLTNAHVVMNSAEVTLQPFNTSDEIPAKVVSLGAGIDLAILEYGQTQALADVQPLAFAEKSPGARATVRVYGYPAGGDSQSVTEGIISRIEHAAYRYGSAGLRMQIDAAVNSGNSGGPAIVDGKIAGLTFSIRPSANSIGYVIPVEEIKIFMQDVADGKYDGKAVLRIDFQFLENEALRRKLGIPEGLTGALVLGVREQPDSPLKPGDVVTKLAEFKIDNRGNCKIDNGVTLIFPRLAAEVAKDGAVDMTVWRSGSEQVIRVPVDSRRRLVEYLAGRTPRYFVYGPIVLSEAYADFYDVVEAGLAGENSAQRVGSVSVMATMQLGNSPLIDKRSARRASNSDELVIIAQILTHETSRGYRPIAYPYTVKTIDGVDVKNLAHAANLLKGAKDEFVEILFHDTLADRIILDRKKVLAGMDTILEENGIVRQESSDLFENSSN